MCSLYGYVITPFIRKQAIKWIGVNIIELFYFARMLKNYQCLWKNLHHVNGQSHKYFSTT